mmetsp:Transcript_84528/g.213153  ORF Transcript_84528/g.213153 Transcript_84528/m.213153 type:complete len:266 (+) Transcript_84528:346-1143(+)
MKMIQSDEAGKCYEKDHHKDRLHHHGSDHPSRLRGWGGVVQVVHQHGRLHERCQGGAQDQEERDPINEGLHGSSRGQQLAVAADNHTQDDKEVVKPSIRGQLGDEGQLPNHDGHHVISHKGPSSKSNRITERHAGVLARLDHVPMMAVGTLALDVEAREEPLFKVKPRRNQRQDLHRAGDANQDLDHEAHQLPLLQAVKVLPTLAAEERGDHVLVQKHASYQDLQQAEGKDRLRAAVDAAVDEEHRRQVRGVDETWEHHHDCRLP